MVVFCLFLYAPPSCLEDVRIREYLFSIASRRLKDTIIWNMRFIYWTCFLLLLQCILQFSSAISLVCLQKCTCHFLTLLAVVAVNDSLIPDDLLLHLLVNSLHLNNCSNLEYFYKRLLSLSSTLIPSIIKLYKKKVQSLENNHPIYMYKHGVHIISLLISRLSNKHNY